MLIYHFLKFSNIFINYELVPFQTLENIPRNVQKIAKEMSIWLTRLIDQFSGQNYVM